MNTYTNPILSGDYPDPTIARNGQDYYLTYSCAKLTPALKIMHSRDLIHWKTKNLLLKEGLAGTLAPDLTYHNGLYYLYYPAYGTIFLVTAKDPLGEWSDPIDLHFHHIDPGHIVTKAGEHYLHTSEGYAAKLTDDGMALAEEPRQVYEGWDYGERYCTEGFWLESPKLLMRGEYYYLISAQGGTAGPASAHMCVAARSKHPMGPWENCPHNPIVHTESRAERWWCRGHGTIFEDHQGQWWIVFHAYEKGFLSRGRCMLMQKVEWTQENWPIVLNNAEEAIEINLDGENVGIDDFNDDFAGSHLKMTWSGWRDYNVDRYTLTGNSLRVSAKDVENLVNANPLTFSAPDHAYAISVCLHRGAGTRAGLLLLFNNQFYCGIAAEDDGIRLYKQGKPYIVSPVFADRYWLKIINHHDQIDYQYSIDGITWRRLDFGCEISGWNHNALSGFTSLRPGFFCCGKGEAEFSDFRYEKL